MTVISQEVKPGVFCRAVVVETKPQIDTHKAVSQITALCGSRGFQIEDQVGMNEAGMNYLQTEHRSQVALLCLAMCFDCPNHIVAPGAAQAAK